MRKTPRYGYVLILSLILGACSVKHVPNELVVDPLKVPRFRVVGALKLVNAQTLSEDVLIPMGTGKLSVNYKQYTDAAVNSLKIELGKNGAVILDVAPKILKLAITDIRFQTPPIFLCVINYTVETGDGYVHGFKVESENWNFRVALDGALAKVVTGVLQDGQVLKYLEK